MRLPVPLHKGKPPGLTVSKETSSTRHSRTGLGRTRLTVSPKLTAGRRLSGSSLPTASSRPQRKVNLTIEPRRTTRI